MRPRAALCEMSANTRYLSLTKPLGMVLEERENGCGAVIESLVSGGAAAESRAVAPGDVLVKVGETDVQTRAFDEVMEMLVAAPSQVSLALDDGLGKLDITPNLIKSLKPEEAVLADLVVRRAVFEIRASTFAQAELGGLLRVEIVLGAGVRQDGRCLVRFFGIFSRDGSSTYSCNISATGRRKPDGSIEILALSCAKDEGWGQTIDLKRDEQTS